jgi:anti-sigma factor ChrR (cupin superfamily)
VSLYALRALPASDVQALEPHIAICPECRRQMERLGPVIESLSWRTDVLHPSETLWERLSRRISPDGDDDGGERPVHMADPAWKEVAPGISCKLLATDAEHDRVSMLVRLAPGVYYPPHRHAGVEELHLLHGELWIDERRLLPGDYNRAEPGSDDKRVWSDTGCTCVLVTSSLDIIF